MPSRYLHLRRSLWLDSRHWLDEPWFHVALALGLLAVITLIVNVFFGGFSLL